MSRILVQISTQIFENKSFYNGGNSWKPKGGLIFNLHAEADDFMYAEDKCIEVIKEMLKEESNDAERFEYVSHELIFNEPVELSWLKFENKLGHGCEQGEFSSDDDDN